MTTKRIVAAPLSVLAVAAAICLVASSADAAKRSFSFPPKAAAGAVGTPYIGEYIRFGNTGEDRVILNFVLPKDYMKNTPFRVTAYLLSGSNCEAKFSVQSLGRIRPGREMVNSIDGVTVVGGNMVEFDGNIAKKTFKVEEAAGFPGQRAGDGILFGLSRLGADPEDTCGSSIYVTSINIRYTAE